MKLTPKAAAIARAFLRDGCTRAAGEAVNSQGGAIIPTELQNEIVVRRNLAGIFRRNTRTVTLASDAAKVPRRTSDPTVGFVAENAVLPGGDFAFDAIGFTARKFGALYRRSAELEEDSISDAAEDLITGISYSFAKAEDVVAFNGDGTSSSGGKRGICNLLVDGAHSASIVTATGHSVFSAITAADIGALVATAPDWAVANGKFYVSAFGFGSCFTALGAVSGWVVGPLGNVEKKLMFGGFECVLTSQLPGSTTLSGKCAILFGDLSLSSTLADRRGFRIRTLRERFADSDEIGFAATQRWDFQHHDLGDNTTAGGIVGLIGG